MIFAERGNKVIAIKEDSIQKYVEQGYMITDGNGTVLKDTVPTDIPNLKKAFVEHKKEIESLKAENEDLKAQIEELKEAAKHIATTAVTPEKVTRAKKSNKAEE